MAIAQIQRAFGQVGNNAVTAITVSATTAGSLLVVLAEAQQNTSETISTITDGGDTFTLCTGSAITTTQGGLPFRLETWYAKNIAGGATTVTVTYSGAVYSQIYVYEFSGASTTAPFVSASTVDTTAVPVSPNITPTVSGSALLAMGSGVATSDVSAPFTGVNPAFQSNRWAFATYLNPPLSATHAIWTPTGSSPYASSIALFNPPVAGASSKKKASTNLVF